MDLILPLLIVGVVALTLLLFVRQLRRERFDVANKGINQPEAVTLLKAAGRALWLEFRYTLPFYLLLASYFYLRVRRDCRREPDTRIIYESGSISDHLTDALLWPVTAPDGTQCDP
ncbi:hypothetical protein [Aggregatilinea lenta]|uniref:hypothetical protein n=1 Tax=Aggregatilinea lenta TaxID=913108 RepID=UPI000E5A6CA7|nr:hypothetical protein [Aggregatilinea lenta]